MIFNDSFEIKLTKKLMLTMKRLTEQLIIKNYTSFIEPK